MRRTGQARKSFTFLGHTLDLGNQVECIGKLQDAVALFICLRQITWLSCRHGTSFTNSLETAFKAPLHANCSLAKKQASASFNSAIASYNIKMSDKCSAIPLHNVHWNIHVLSLTCVESVDKCMVQCFSLSQTFNKSYSECWMYSLYTLQAITCYISIMHVKEKKIVSWAVYIWSFFFLRLLLLFWFSDSMFVFFFFFFFLLVDCVCYLWPWWLAEWLYRISY